LFSFEHYTQTGDQRTPGAGRASKRKESSLEKGALYVMESWD
jgi:hypothetical protein